MKRVAMLEIPLESLLSEIHLVLGRDLVGAYLYGSYVSGGFDPGVSDLDLVVVTAPRVETIDLAALERVHADFASHHPEWDDRIEVAYLGRKALASFRTSQGPVAVISPGEPFHLRSEPPSAWLQNWYLVRETGLALYGPDPTAIIPLVAWSEFVTATRRYAGEMGKRSVEALTPGALAYGVLTMCRALMTVRTQRHVSKEEAAAWTRERMPEWASLIDAALRCRMSRGAVGFDDDATRAAAGRFIRLLGRELAGPAPE
jgi:predicted nucleotidyltransferase